MTEVHLWNVDTVNVSQFAPPTAVAITLKITITPPTGAVLVYSQTSADPILFNGPSSTKDVPIKGAEFYVQCVQGATDCQIHFVGWKDNI